MKDICYSPSIPSFEEHYIEKIVSNLFPCAIMTPLDCFWEGSKLLGPDYPIMTPGLPINFKWTSLNPRALVQGIQKQWSSQTESTQSSFPFSFLLDIMDRVSKYFFFFLFFLFSLTCVRRNCPSGSRYSRSHTCITVELESLFYVSGFVWRNSERKKAEREKKTQRETCLNTNENVFSE